MTDMKRITFAIPNDIDQYICEMKKKESNKKDSYSEIVRKLLIAGIESARKMQ